jgi:hypothetical protein
MMGVPGQKGEREIMKGERNMWIVYRKCPKCGFSPIGIGEVHFLLAPKRNGVYNRCLNKKCDWLERVNQPEIG